MAKTITLYLDIISPFAYMAFWLTRNSPAFTAAKDLKISYVPILLGGIMQQTGNTSPIYIKNKGKWIGVERHRWAKAFRIPTSEKMPNPFPQPTVNTQRALCYVQKEMGGEDLNKAFEALYKAFWVEEKTIGKVDVIKSALSTAFSSAEVDKIVEGIKSDAVKKALKDNSDQAYNEGAFGLPWFVAEDGQGRKEAFWGVDHIGQMMEFLGLELKGEDGRYKKVCEIDKEDNIPDGWQAYVKQYSEYGVGTAAEVLYHLGISTIEALIDGDYKTLLQLAQNDDLPEQLDDDLDDDTTHVKGEARGDRKAIIYGHHHVDDNGDPPTANEFLTVIRYVQGYIDYAEGSTLVSDVRYAKNISQAVKAPRESKKDSTGKFVRQPRKTWQTKANGYWLRYSATKTTLKALKKWIKHISEIIKAMTPAERNEPFKHAMSEVGWTAEPIIRRFAHHEHGDSGNKVMNIIDGATRAAFPNEGYRMRWLIILEINNDELAVAGERTVSRLALSYTSCGATNQVLGGSSTASSYKGIASIGYLDACSQQLYALRSRFYPERSAVLKELFELREIKETLVQHDDAMELGKKANEIDAQIKQLEGNLETLTGTFESLFPAWEEDIREQSAINDDLSNLDSMLPQLDKVQAAMSKVRLDIADEN